MSVRDAGDEELGSVSARLGLSLSLEEMRRVKRYFVAKGREPTEVELQSIAQAWSEHCCYKSSRKILEKFIFGVKAKEQQNLLEVKEDAGVVEFDEEHAYVVAFESHNHPSAVEPYGGAATGIGGIVRDVVCMGAQPVALVDPLFFGPLDCGDSGKGGGVKHPRFLFEGVVAGISDYGNRIGIPTCAGSVYFDEGYLGNCVVNVGCVGIMRKSDLRRSRAKPGEVLVLVGGKTGRDGIHGVTFASGELAGEEEFRSRSAVQVGDPITKEPLIHAILEANERGLISGMKDLGGGGLSCAVSEMCHAGGCSANVWLERVKLKEEGLAAWEIWVSESQERFLISVSREKVEELLAVFEAWDLDAVVVGQTFKKSLIKNASLQTLGKSDLVRIFYEGEKVFELELDFLVASPVCERPREVRRAGGKAGGKTREEKVPEEPSDYNEVLRGLLAAPNIASREAVVRRYDHEVRGATVLKPLQGRLGKETHGDAAVLKPLEKSYKGLAISSDVNPSFCRLDPFWGAASAVDEVCRNLTAVGAVPHSFADCLNFGNPEKPDRLGDFYECCRGLGFVASSLGVPFVSGNVSFYNESAVLGEAIPPTPAVLGVGLCEDVRECVTVDAKEAGNSLYLLGETRAELGGSEYFKLRGVKAGGGVERGKGGEGRKGEGGRGEGGVVPRVDPEVLKRRMSALRCAMQEGVVASCHDISEGGLAVAVCEMLLGGGGEVGAFVDLGKVNSKLRSDFKLFSESNTRWVVEVWGEEERRFEELLRGRGVRAAKIGETVGGEKIQILDGGEKKKELVNLSLEEVREAWVWEI